MLTSLDARKWKSAHLHSLPFLPSLSLLPPPLPLLTLDGPVIAEEPSPERVAPEGTRCARGLSTCPHAAPTSRQQSSRTSSARGGQYSQMLGGLRAAGPHSVVM